MFFFFSTLSLSSDCDTYYTSSGCPVCVTHFVDRQCGWCKSQNKCISYDESSTCPDQFYYGPEANCNSTTPAPYNPTPAPQPEPTPLPEECSIYTADGCEICTSHYADRKCGWNKVAKQCQSNSTKTCNETEFYFGDNAKCDAEIPGPTPTPWPRYVANTSYCRSLSNSWCTNCVSSDPSMQCVWCYDTHECAMGDSEGFFFGTCKNFAYTNDTKCRGVVSDGAIVGIRVGLAIFVAIMIIIGCFICYKTIKKPEEQANPNYENVQ